MTTNYEHESADVAYSTDEVRLQADNDRDIMANNANLDVVWTFDGRPSGPLWCYLSKLEIPVEDANSGDPIPNPGPPCS